MIRSSLIAATALFVCASFTAMAQEDANQPRQRGARERGEFRRPVSPLMSALDADGDGVISGQEIEGAAAALKKLDKNGDGQLSADETRPQGFGGGFDRGALFGRLDENKDGKLSSSEIPERMQPFLQRLDTNSDGDITREEYDSARSRFGNRGGRDGERGERTPRPDTGN